MVNAVITSIVISILLFNFTKSNDSNTAESCTVLYEKGVEAYLENRFEDCVDNFEKALIKYKSYRKTLQNCRLNCKNSADLAEPLYPINIDNLLFFETAVRQTLCIIECENDSPEILANYNVNNEVEKLFEEQKPYEYLHLCYYQTKQLMKAASSAFTYLVANPDDKIMRSNLNQYITMKEVNKKELVNFEAKDYVYLYVHGSDAYDRKMWQDVVNYMENSLGDYLQAEDECRAHCEGPFDQGWYPDFIPSISNHFTVCLKCKEKCRKKLGSLNGEIYDDLLPSHYHYLQFAYYKLGKLEQACKAVASYLLFYPSDETMLANKQYYSKLPKSRQEYFQPREEALHYFQRQTYEERILKFIAKEFNLMSARAKIKAPKPNFQIAMTEKQLRGQKRFVTDGLITKEQCRKLIEICKSFAIYGDGYEGKKSPHTIMETFEGVTLSRAIFLVYFGLLNEKYLELYINVTNGVLNIIKDYFEIKEKLYFSYTHLVCRSAIPEAPINRTDFSHKIHADNCNILNNGTCLKSDPAYTWRDYSAILYLNEDFEGGEFVFSSNKAATHIESTIKPKCGRMVAFTSGEENLHGVKAVKKGSRCAIGIWFTHNPQKADRDRVLAHNVLENKLNYHMYITNNISAFTVASEKT